MKKVKFVIEEVISQEFELELDETKPFYDQIREKYKKREIVVEDPSLTETNVLIDEGDGLDLAGWNKMF